MRAISRSSGLRGAIWRRLFDVLESGGNALRSILPLGNRGLAAQTSDVAITGAHIRKFALAHSIAAFFFNTVLVAAAVNFAVSLD